MRLPRSEEESTLIIRGGYVEVKGWRMWVALLGYNDFEADGGLLRRSKACRRSNMAYYCNKAIWENLVELGGLSPKPALH
jgi:hypothetical protein